MHTSNISSIRSIYVKLDVGQLKVETDEVHASSRTSWDKASEENKNAFTAAVATKLNEITMPGCISCSNLHCSDHSDQIDSYTLEVLEAIESAAKESLPAVGGGGQANSKRPPNRIPGWNDLVKPFYDESKFWHSIWESAGKPSTGNLLKLMKDSKHQYKYALRRV